MFETPEDRRFALETLKLSQKEIEEVYVKTNGYSYFEYPTASALKQ